MKSCMMMQSSMMQNCRQSDEDREYSSLEVRLDDDAMTWDIHRIWEKRQSDEEKTWENGEPSRNRL